MTWSKTAVLTLLALLSTPVHAQDEQLAEPSTVSAAPPHLFGVVGGGLPVRITKNVDFDQRRVAPAFVDLFVGYSFAGDATLQHGLALGASLNLSDDGGFTEPVEVAAQWVLMPSYMGLWLIDDDWLGLGHLGLPIVLTGGRSTGLELGLGLGYRMRAGLGVLAEASLNAFPGAGSTMHVSAAFELGVFVDYEWLP